MMLDEVEARGVCSALRGRSVVADADFDRVFPRALRPLSPLHWTPVEVALRAAALLASTPATRILDVGSGVGKLCLIGAITTTATWCGVEARPAMVQAANLAALRLGVAHRARFWCADATLADWSSFDAVYMFNPFAEMLFARETDRLARRAAFLGAVERARIRIAALRPGARLVTYHGFGGELPGGFDLAHRESAYEDTLDVWVRGSGSAA